MNTPLWFLVGASVTITANFVGWWRGWEEGRKFEREAIRTPKKPTYEGPERRGAAQ